MDTIEQRVIEQIEICSEQDEIKLSDKIESLLSEDSDMEVYPDFN